MTPRNPMHWPKTILRSPKEPIIHIMFARERTVSLQDLIGKCHSEKDWFSNTFANYNYYLNLFLFLLGLYRQVL